MGTSLKTQDTGLQSAGTVVCHFSRPGVLERWKLALNAILVISPLVLCSGCKATISEKPVGAPVAIKAPLGLPRVPIPADNPPTADTIALGRRLFYDSRLSKDNSLACSSCHDSRFDYTDGLKLSKGVGGATGIRNAPTVMNSVYLPLQFWDGRAISLEQQAASPIADPLEMNQPHEVSVSKLG